MSSGIDRPSFVYVHSKKDNVVKAPFTLLVDLSRLAGERNRIDPAWLRSYVAESEIVS
jgi:hypothetical protein